MAKFISEDKFEEALEKLLKNSDEKLILVMPELQFSSSTKEILSNLNTKNFPIVIAYRQDNLDKEEHIWLDNQKNISTKCISTIASRSFINEKEYIVEFVNPKNEKQKGIRSSKKGDSASYEESLESLEYFIS